MKIYLADSCKQNLFHVHRYMHPRGIHWRLLISYHYFKNTNLSEFLSEHFVPPYPDILLDSGAFSAFTQGATIDLKAYCAYIKQYRHNITTYVNLDVIGSASGTLANQRLMEHEGLRPLPVFHVGEDWKYLIDYVKHYSYIALGGMVPYMSTGKKKLMPWLVKAFRLAKGLSVFHGLGCTTWSINCAFPWYSVDSSTWGASYRFGRVNLFDAKKGVFVEARLGRHDTCYEYAHVFRSLGFDPADFAERSRNTRQLNCAVAALSAIKSGDWLDERHGAITIPEREKIA